MQILGPPHRRSLPFSPPAPEALHPYFSRFPSVRPGCPSVSLPAQVTTELKSTLDFMAAPVNPKRWADAGGVDPDFPIQVGGGWVMVGIFVHLKRVGDSSRAVQ